MPNRMPINDVQDWGDQNLMFVNKVRDGGPNFRLANQINR